MAYIVEPDVVRYACMCGLLKPISRLYFCRHCLHLRCGFCVCHEVDSLFCGKCLENLPSTEAKLKKNKCSNCLECPSCHQQLSSKAATVAPKNPEDPKATPKKVIYLCCLNCRWTTRDVGIPDQEVGKSGWPEHENVHTNRLNAIMNHYKKLVLKEKQQQMDKDKKQRKYTTSLAERTGVTASILRKRLGMTELKNPLLEADDLKPAVASKEIVDSIEHLLTTPIKLNDITTIDQRLKLPDWQPTAVDKLYPVHKQLSVKRSLRCRSCEHNVSKPEYSPNSIKFKIQLFAYYHIPEIRIVTVEPLRIGKQCELLIKLINPTQHQTTITILPLEHLDAIQQEDTKVIEDPPETKEPLSFQLLQSSLTSHPRQINAKVGTDVSIPTSSIILPARDDAAEYDDTGETQNFQDDPKLVVFRKSNKAVIKLLVAPMENLELGEEVIAGFTMQHVYTSTIATTTENKEPQKFDHKMKIYLTLGTLVGSQ
ncbi:PREDICTED: dynactin subunit 4 [Nicrophorus vespilloides]|uniref:Dynactin subunit 4 n=1 Tax=Nicrophorus vespilloides TaxID=110193 RepID=A0ABM1MRB7_NICVS|nr:PREDICTED: dynactin subunit 4 [Nicrophorus vespilloides]